MRRTPAVFPPRPRYSPEQLSRVSCAYFAASTLRGPPEPPYCGRFLIGPHHEQWDELLQAHRRVCILAPRDHGKTFYFDFAYPLWRASHQPGKRGYIFSGTKDQATRILGDVKDEIEGNPALQWLYPDGKRRKLWSATAIECSNGHRIYARGFGTKTRGAHPDWIVCDDGLNDEDAYSEVVRRKHVDYFLTAISGMITPGGQIVVVGTPFHQRDLYAELATNPEYAFRRYTALDEAGRPLWPARYDAGRLAQKRRELGSVRFTREYMCQPISDDMSLFPSHLFRGSPTEVFTEVLGRGARYWDERGVTRRFIGVDLAISASTGADYTVLFVLGTDASGNRWVLDIIREKGLPFQQQLSLIQAAARKYDADLVYIESNQMQRVFGDELIRTTDLPIRRFTTTGGPAPRGRQPTGTSASASKNTLEGGVPSLRVLLENGKVRIPRGDERSIEVTDQWIAEMRNFTWVDGKLQGVGGHDDMVMAFWIADQAVRHGGFSFSTGAEVSGKETLDEILAEQTAEEVPRGPERAEAGGGGDPVARLLARFGTGAPGEDPPEEPGNGTGGGASGNLVGEDDEPGGVDSAALRALWGRG